MFVETAGICAVSPRPAQRAIRNEAVSYNMKLAAEHGGEGSHG
jgi:hypothetical protein